MLEQSIVEQTLALCKIEENQDCHLIQGDCLELMKDIPDNSVDMILCDLPYDLPHRNPKNTWDNRILFEPLWQQYKRIVKNNAAIVLTASQPFTTNLISSNVKDFRYCWTWVKPYTTGFMNANKMPLRNVEDVCVFYKKLPTYNPQGIIEVNRSYTRAKDKETTIYSDMRLKTGKQIQKFTNYPNQILKFDKDKNGHHPTQKPVALMEYLIKTYTNLGELVLDNCFGSGSTAIACLNTGRRFIGMELDPDYYNIAKNRIEKHLITTKHHENNLSATTPNTVSSRAI